MNLAPRFYVIEDEKTSFYAGYCIKPKNNANLYELCETLNSDLMKEHIGSVSKVIAVVINLMQKFFERFCASAIL